MLEDGKGRNLVEKLSAPGIDPEAVIPPEVLGVDSKYRAWKYFLQREGGSPSRGQMYDGVSYDPLGILARFVYGEVFTLGEAYFEGLSLGLNWVLEGGHSVQPKEECLCEMRLDREANESHWLLALSFFTPKKGSCSITNGATMRPFDLTRCELLQWMADAGVSLEDTARFIEEAGWGNLADLYAIKKQR